MTSLRQAVALAIDTAGATGQPIVGREIVRAVRISHPMRDWFVDEVLEAETLKVRSVVSEVFKEPATPEYIEKHLEIHINGKNRDIVQRIPTKYICVDKANGGVWLSCLHADIEDLRANYDMKRHIVRAGAAKVDEMRDLVSFVEASGERTLAAALSK